MTDKRKDRYLTLVQTMPTNALLDMLHKLSVMEGKMKMINLKRALDYAFKSGIVLGELKFKRIK